MNFVRLREAFRTLYSKRYLRKSLFLSVLTLLIVWLAFFDSHSLVKRLTWRQEAIALSRENEVLKQRIEELERQLNTNLSEDVIEQLARERYGMRMEGETVYQVEEIQ